MDASETRAYQHLLATTHFEAHPNVQALLTFDENGYSHIQCAFQHLVNEDVIECPFTKMFTYDEGEQPGRNKGAAVSKDGKILRIKVNQKGRPSGVGYNDRFLSRDGHLVLEYASGDRVERRRQKSLRKGDIVLVEVGSNNKHALFRTQFIKFEYKLDVMGNRATFTTVRILGHYSPMSRESTQTSNDSPIRLHELQLSKRKHEEESEAPLSNEGAYGLIESTSCPSKKLQDAEHLFFDTESAAPVGDHGPGCILQIAWVVTNRDFETLQSHCEYLSYPDHLRSCIGNDESSSVLKVPMRILRHGNPVESSLARVKTVLERVTASGGVLFAHNIGHDLAQLQKTATTVGFRFGGLHLRCIDTLKLSMDYVKGAAQRFVKLGVLAQLSGIHIASFDSWHTADVDTRVLQEVARINFPPDVVDSGVYVETRTLE